MATYIITRSDELYHYGISGQKWHVRRYQNEDGTLTDEGYQRYYGKRFEKESRKQQRLNAKSDQQKQVKIATESGAKAKRNLGIGLAGAATAGAGYLAIQSVKQGSRVPGITQITEHHGNGFTKTSYDVEKGAGLAVGGMLAIGIGAPTAAIGLGKATYHGIKAGVANYRASAAGHTKAAEKAKAHLDNMREMFANTPYASLVEERFGK